jgi:nitrite reductase (NO-forming)
VSTPTGRTTRVDVTATSMRFTPGTVQVPAGNRLVIDLENTDSTSMHDLVLDSGADSGRLAPGRSAVLDVGVIGRDIEGWCSVVGHRQMGRIFHIHVTGLTKSEHDTGEGMAAIPGLPGMTGTDPSGSAASNLDFAASPGVGFRTHDPSLPPWRHHGYIVVLSGSPTSRPT